MVMQTISVNGRGVADVPGENFRLTRRGRVVLFGAAVALLSVASSALFINVAASATASTAAAPADYGYVVVMPGDTLWSIAERLDPHTDPRDTVFELMRFNQLVSSNIDAFSQIAVPGKFADNPQVHPAVSIARQ